MKNNKIYFVVFIVLLIAAAGFYLSKKSGTTARELRDFAIQDTSVVTKIFMVNKQNESILLKRGENNVWTVNEKFVARKNAVKLLLKTFKRWDVKSPVAKAAFENVVKNLAATHVKVEIYTDNEKQASKVVYIGGPTQDNYGTYMMLENSNTPFIVHIPGFSGYLSSRFFIDESEWRDGTIMNYAYNKIKSVSLTNHKKTNQSFIIENHGDNKYSLKELKSNLSIENFDTIKVKQYIGNYKKLGLERVADGISKNKRDSIFNCEPIYDIVVTDTNNKKTSISTFVRLSDRFFNEDGSLNEFDPERMYGRINNDTSVVILQYFVFDPLFVDIDYFKK